ncbi:MAG: family 43 glycosylhydrolase [Clostridia bacterium]|nr:family 43 glycosylhydrolase [Clostridia bacterium]
MKNGEKWLDIDGNPIEAHGGCRLYHEGKLYWYGEDRRGDNYVSCYVLEKEGWKFLNSVLTTNSKTQATRVVANLDLRKEISNDDKIRVIIERPKVVYNKKTKKFVMCMHYENGVYRQDACAAVATCDTPYGDFVYHGAFNPMGHHSRDCTLFEEDGKMYFISSARRNADLHVYLLQDDYLNVSRLVNVLFSNEKREAPAFVRKDGKTLLITSACTGWYPNQATFSVADSITGDFSVNENIGDETTFLSQSAFLYQNEKGEIVFFGDRWGGSDLLQTRQFDYTKSGYCAYKVEFDGETAKLIYSEEAFC